MIFLLSDTFDHSFGSSTYPNKNSACFSFTDAILWIFVMFSYRNLLNCPKMELSVSLFLHRFLRILLYFQLPVMTRLQILICSQDFPCFMRFSSHCVRIIQKNILPFSAFVCFSSARRNIANVALQCFLVRRRSNVACSLYPLWRLLDPVSLRILFSFHPLSSVSAWTDFCNRFFNHFPRVLDLWNFVQLCIPDDHTTFQYLAEINYKLLW